MSASAFCSCLVATSGLGLLAFPEAEIASRRLRLHGSFQACLRFFDARSQKEATPSCRQEVDRLRRGVVSMGQAVNRSRSQLLVTHLAHAGQDCLHNSSNRAGLEGGGPSALDRGSLLQTSAGARDVASALRSERTSSQPERLRERIVSVREGETPSSLGEASSTIGSSATKSWRPWKSKARSDFRVPSTARRFPWTRRIFHQRPHSSHLWCLRRHAKGAGKGHLKDIRCSTEDRATRWRRKHDSESMQCCLIWEAAPESQFRVPREG